MAKKKDTDDQSAQDQQDQNQDQNQDQQQDQDQDDQSQQDKEPKSPFSSEQEQYMGSWLGRIVAKQLDEKVMPHLNKEPAPAPAAVDSGIPTEGDAIVKFNEKLAEKAFGGDFLGAVQMANEVQNKAKSNVTSLQKVQTDKLIVSYSEKPYYKDLFSEMKDIAHEKVALGFPPEVAVELAYVQTKVDLLEKKLSGGQEDTDSLEMLSGGKRSKSTKKVTLPPSLKAAAERDIAAGYYKTEEEWIAALSPQVRKANGLGE